MMWSETEGDTFYVFRNGRLVFKEWRSRNRSALLDVRCEPRYFREARTPAALPYTEEPATPPTS